MPERVLYPVDERGIPYVPEGFNVCYEICLKGVKNRNRHHLQNRSTGKGERRLVKNYIETGSMIVRGCVCKHEDLHAQYDAPPLPDTQTMYDVVQGDLSPVEAPVNIRSRVLLNIENTEASRW